MADQPEPRLSLILDAGKEVMHLTIHSGEKMLGGIILSAVQLEEAIAGLTRLRSQMTPPLPSSLADGTPVREIKGAAYDFGVDNKTRELIFSLQDKTLGWLSFRFGSQLLERMLRVVNSAKNPLSDGPKQ
jgi:hypothetical protein